LKVKEARMKIIIELNKKGLLVKQEKITHRTPVSERSGAEIEFIEMPEFYLKQLDFKEKIKNLSKKINFYPESSRKILEDWIDSITIDWPISRRRFYATPIPLWYSGDLVAVPKPGKYYQPWKESVPRDAEVFESEKKIGTLKDKKFKSLKWKGETRVLDTWMDSSISELFILKYKDNYEFFKKAYPVNLRPQGKEIVRTWLYYTLLRGFLETRKMPFDDVWINQHILDNKGRKMSKSLGNIIDPQKLLKKYGAEAIRLWAATEGDLSRHDLSCSEERIRAELKTINKLLNITKFVIQFKKPKKKKLTELDKLFIDCLDYETHHIGFNYERYNFFKPAVELRSFLWDTFASHYLELVKARAYNEEKKFTKQESEAAIYTLYYLLERLVVLLSPIIPQVTSVLASELKISLEKFPKINYPQLERRVRMNDELWRVNQIKQFNRDVWKKKKDQGMRLRDEISGIKIPKELKPFEKDLIVTHNLK
ncbi:MAG: class I tRNA ligase family protein, partial [Nanoarchaeota archaeon]|nr:class I tRNA ligase family protein [Nanoarchaeota archaeon]